jgi:hypothetical protein
VPVDRQALILTRALAYDSNLKGRAGAEIIVGVLAKGGNVASDQIADAVTQAFGALGTVKVQGLPIKGTKVTFTSFSALITAIKGQSLDALYICPGLENELAGLLEVTRQQKVLSMGGREDHVTKGASVGVFVVDAKPTIYINLPSAKSEGADFGSDLLRLAKVIK